ncbi:MAG: hypothetical protein DWQ21_09870 [Bacteroidetes bacterium]|nr:MAG: hypothetical protein DWQ21_09870 [Bacteroidota bacterium]REK51970.1 MAG: hypothetical protein DWQ49_13755 [Bacteroidota bacterium]
MLVDPYHDRYFKDGKVVGVRYDGPVGSQRRSEYDLGLGILTPPGSTEQGKMDILTPPSGSYKKEKIDIITPPGSSSGSFRPELYADELQEWMKENPGEDPFGGKPVNQPKGALENIFLQRFLQERLK